MLSSIVLAAALHLPRAPPPRLQIPSTAGAPPTYDTSAPWDDRTPRTVDDAPLSNLQLDGDDAPLSNLQLDGDDSELRVRTYSPLPAAPSAGAAFATRCEELAALVRAQGHAGVPTTNPSLARWCGRQRRLRREGALPDARVEQLDELGFEWDVRAARWEARLGELERLLDEDGRMPSRSADAEGERALAAWASRQRAARRDGRLDAERVAALDELGFEWDPIQQAFDERLGALAAALAARAPLGASLARWAGRQRAAKAAGRLPAERVEALDELSGWSWEAAARGGGGGGGVAYAACASAGRALLVSVGRRRDGAAAELSEARDAMRQLGYEVVTVENPSADELRASLEVHAKASGWEGHASSVVALMAHGSERQLECQCGGEVPTAALFRALNSKAAPALVGKPKIFLVQACRTGERPLLADGPTAAGAMAAAADAAPSAAAPQLSDEHDYLWGFATTPGSPAYRGAMFAALLSVVVDLGGGARATSWLELLQRTNEVMASDYDGLPSMEICSTCRGAPFSPEDLTLGEAS